MDKVEAKEILAKELTRYRSMSHSQLLGLMGESQTIEVLGSSGTKYSLEFEVLWDHEPEKDLRVIGSIDDGGWAALHPLSEDFILRSDGSFVDE